MGLFRFFSGSSFDGPDCVGGCSGSCANSSETPSQPRPPLPDPRKYRIIAHDEYHTKSGKSWTALWLQYDGCTNYEGKKILLYEASLKKLLEQGSLDPHFSDSKNFISPVARFEPTARGWKLALDMMLLTD